MKKLGRVGLLVVLTCGPQLLFSAPAGTAFTYQGRLSDGAGAAAGSYDFKFSVFDSETGGNQIGLSITHSALGITNGLFTVPLDFGPGVFDAYARWLEIGVRAAGSGSFTTLTGRQRLTPAPYAISAESVAGPVPADKLIGSLGAVTLPTGGNWALNSTLTIDAGTLTVDPGSQRVGIGTTTPAAPLTLRPSGTFYGLEHTDGTRRLSTYLSDIGCWLGSVSPDRLHFFVNDGLPSMTIDLTGHVGIGTTTPEYALDVAGGAVNAGVFLFNTPRQHVIAIGAASFQSSPVSHSVDYFTEVHDPESPNGATVSGDLNRHMFAPVSLPHAATITEVTFWLYHGPGAGWATPEVEFRRVRHDRTATNMIASVKGFDNGVAAYTTTPVGYNLVDNVNFQYYVVADFLSLENGVRAVVIRYTTTEAD